MKVIFQLSPKRQSLFLSLKDVFEVTEVNGWETMAQTDAEAITGFFSLKHCSLAR